MRILEMTLLTIFPTSFFFYKFSTCAIARNLEKRCLCPLCMGAPIHSQADWLLEHFDPRVVVRLQIGRVLTMLSPSRFVRRRVCECTLFSRPNDCCITLKYEKQKHIETSIHKIFLIYSQCLFIFMAHESFICFR